MRAVFRSLVFYILHIHMSVDVVGGHSVTDIVKNIPMLFACFMSIVQLMSYSYLYVNVYSL